MSNDPFPTEQSESMPAGWYPDQSGQQRYWDGTAWTEHVQDAAPAVQQYAGYGQSMMGVPTSDEKTMATLSHALQIIAGFLAPLIIMLVKGDQSVFVKHHAVEGLNFAITMFIALFVSALLMIVLIGFLLFPVVWIGGIVLNIMAAMAANRGEYYRYPFNIRLISGPAV